MRDRFAELLTDVTNIHEQLLTEQKQACAELQHELDDATDEIGELKNQCSDLRAEIRELESEETKD